MEPRSQIANNQNDRYAMRTCRLPLTGITHRAALTASDPQVHGDGRIRSPGGSARMRKYCSIWRAYSPRYEAGDAWRIWDGNGDAARDGSGDAASIDGGHRSLVSSYPCQEQREKHVAGRCTMC